MQKILYKEHTCQSAIYWTHTLTRVFSCKFSELFLRTPLDGCLCCIPSLPNKYFIFCESKLNLIHNQWLFAKYVVFVCLLQLSLNLLKLHYFHWKYLTAIQWFLVRHVQVIDFVNTFSIVGIVGTPSPPLLKRGGGVEPSKNWVTGGVPKILLERGDNPEKEGGW